MNYPGEHLQITGDPAQSLGNGLLWRVTEASANWKGDLLSTTRREHPMPLHDYFPTPNPGAPYVTVPREDRVVRVPEE